MTRKFTRLKLSLMPYLYAAGLEASRTGTPVLRPMQLEFPDDPTVGYLDRQYLLGGELLVAPVFSADGTVEFYLPAGTWTSYLTGEQLQGPGWHREHHGYDTLPLYVREGAILPIGGRDDRPDYDYLDGITVVVYPSSTDAPRSITVTTPDGTIAEFLVERNGAELRVGSDYSGSWSARVAGGTAVQAVGGEARLSV